MTETKSTIGDTGMTVEELRAWAGLPGSGIALSHEYYVSILDALESAQREADEARKRAEKTAAQIAECEEANEALCEKIKSLSAHHTCGCSYDTREDVCMHHSPQLTAALGRAEKAEAQVAEMQILGRKIVAGWAEHIDGCGIHGEGYRSSVDCNCGLGDASDQLYALSGNKALAVIEAAKTLHRIGMNRDEGDGAAFMEASAQMGRALAEFEGGGK